MIVYAQPQKLELKRNQDYRRIKSLIEIIFSCQLDQYFRSAINKLSIFTKINLDFRTTFSCFTQISSVNTLYAVVVALLQRSKI